MSKRQTYQTFPPKQESVGVYQNGIIEGIEKLTEEEEFEKYFRDNITLDNDGENREEITKDFFDEIRETRRNIPPSRYMKGEDFTYAFKKSC